MTSQLEKIIQKAQVGCLKDRAKERADFCNNANSIRAAIELACKSENVTDGKLLVHKHQRRVGRIALKEAARHLIPIASSIEQVADFEHLHGLIDSQIRHVPRIGDLAIYDISERIGWFLAVEPTRVFLHADTLTGARNLLDRKLSKHLDLSELPDCFQSLSASEIETILCVHKDDWQGQKNSPQNRSRKLTARRKSC